MPAVILFLTRERKRVHVPCSRILWVILKWTYRLGKISLSKKEHCKDSYCRPEDKVILWCFIIIFTFNSFLITCQLVLYAVYHMSFLNNLSNMGCPDFFLPALVFLKPLGKTKTPCKKIQTKTFSIRHIMLRNALFH